MSSSSSSIDNCLISRSKRTEMIAIIDKEIIDCKVQLQLLRLQLKQYCADKKKKERNESNKQSSVVDKSIQTIGMEDIAIQVNHDDFVAEKVEKSIPISVPLKIVNNRPKRTTKLQIEHQTQPKTFFNHREQQYLDRINQMKQRKHTNNTMIMNKENTNVAVEKLQTKITRSVAIETMDPFPSHELDINPFSDQTVYLDLPPPKSSNHKMRQKPKFKTNYTCDANEYNKDKDVEELSEHLRQSLTTVNHGEKQTEKLMNECLIDDDVHDNTSSLFRTLLQSSSNQQSVSSTTITSTNQQIIGPTRANDSISTMTNITLPSMEQSAANLTNQTILVDDSIDHEKFWNDVFTTAGLKSSEKC
mgnify:CR=1 FL=1